MKALIFLIPLVFLLSGCITEKKKLGQGAKTVAPMGYTDLCKREPKNKLCQKQ